VHRREERLQLAREVVRRDANVVERRNRESWKIDDAVRMLGAAALGIIDRA